MEDVKSVLDKAKDLMAKAVEHTQNELKRIRAGKASPSILDALSVDYYGTPTLLSQVSSVTVPDARSIVIKPYEKNMISEIEKAITNSDLGLNPQNDGDVVRLNIPPLTEERRKEIVKQVKSEVEQGRVSLRNVRKDMNDTLKKLQKDGIAEDEVKRGEDEIQKLTDASNKKLDEILASKEKEVMTI